MYYFTEETITNLNQKLAWGERSLQRIITDMKNEDNVIDHFCAYLTALQKAWFYFGKWVDGIQQ